MKVVNFIGAPGSGKSTAAAELYALLSKRGANVELVTEYMKEVVWNRQMDLVNNQDLLFSQQRQRLTRLQGKVDFVITDSPLLLAFFYNDNPSFPMDTFSVFARQCWEQFNNYTVFINRNHGFQQEGRYHDEIQSIEIEAKMRASFSEDIDAYVDSRNIDMDSLADSILRGEV